MPNWCDNNLHIEGDEKEVARLVGLVKHRRRIEEYLLEDIGCVFDFERIVPYDKKVKELGYYDWHINNWGTKWNSYQARISARDNGCVVFEFQTAWSPPVPVLVALKKQFPGLEMEIDWEEEGGLAGNIGFNKKGKVVLSDREHSREE